MPGWTRTRWTRRQRCRPPRSRSREGSHSPAASETEDEFRPRPGGRLRDWRRDIQVPEGNAVPEPRHRDRGPAVRRGGAYGDQVLALSHRVLALELTPYVDMAVWTPFGRKSMRANKFRTWIPGMNGTWISKEVPGPENHEQLLVSWRFFLSARR